MESCNIGLVIRALAGLVCTTENGIQIGPCSDAIVSVLIGFYRMSRDIKVEDSYYALIIACSLSSQTEIIASTHLVGHLLQDLISNVKLFELEKRCYSGTFSAMLLDFLVVVTANPYVCRQLIENSDLFSPLQSYYRQLVEDKELVLPHGQDKYKVFFQIYILA